MRTRHHAFTGLLVVLLLIAGCARSGSGSAAPGGSTSATPAPPATSGNAPDPQSSGSAKPPNAPPPSGVTLVLTGQVEPGVEARCLMLKDAGRTYQLIGGDPAIVKAGARVRVTGHVAVGVMSYCMQGQPFQVTEAHAV
jgi:hypothetical protein